MTGPRTLGQARSFPRIQTPTQPASKRHSPDDSSYTLSSPSSPPFSHRHRGRKSFDVGQGSSISSLPAYADIFTSSPTPALTKSFSTNAHGKHPLTLPVSQVDSQPEWRRLSLSNRPTKDKAEVSEEDEEVVLSSDQPVPSWTTGDAKVPSSTGDDSRAKLSHSPEPLESSKCQTPRTNGRFQARDYLSPSLSLSASSISLTPSLTTRLEHEGRLGSPEMDEEFFQYEDPSIWLDRMLNKSTSALATAQVLLSGALGVRGALYDWNEREIESEGVLSRIWVETQCRSKRDDDHTAALTSLSNETLLILGGRSSKSSAGLHGISTVEVERNGVSLLHTSTIGSPKQEGPIISPSEEETKPSPAVSIPSYIQPSDPTASSPSSTTSFTTTKGWSPSTTTNRAPSFIRVRSSPIDNVSTPYSTRDSKKVRSSADDASPLMKRSASAQVRPMEGLVGASEEKDESAQDIVLAARKTSSRVQSIEASPDPRSYISSSIKNVRSSQMRYSLSFPPEQQPSSLPFSFVSPTNHSSDLSKVEGLPASTNRYSPLESATVDGTSFSLQAVPVENQENRSGELSEALIRLRNLGAGTSTDLEGGSGASGSRKSWVGGWFGVA